MEYSCDGSGNEGEGRAVPVREGRSTRKEVARQRRETALTVIRLQGKSCPNGLVKKSVNFGDKNEDISESVSSFDFGAIFDSSLGQKLSRNAFVAKILFPERISPLKERFQV